MPARAGVASAQASRTASTVAGPRPPAVPPPARLPVRPRFIRPPRRRAGSSRSAEALRLARGALRPTPTPRRARAASQSSLGFAFGGLHAAGAVPVRLLERLPQSPLEVHRQHDALVAAEDHDRAPHRVDLGATVLA